MLSFIGNTIKIALLVILGLTFFGDFTQIIKFVKGGYKNMNKNVVIGKMCKFVGGFAVVLGLAFYCGACLAKLQGVLLQIVPLAVTGTVCEIAGILCLVIGKVRSKRA